jgi:hypothetical protein
MAGRKLTVLPALGEFPAADDLMYVVDVSDTSESPQGTSKAVEFRLTQTRSLFSFVITENAATLAQEINKLGGVVSLTNTGSFAFTLERTGGATLTGQVAGGVIATSLDNNGDPIIAAIQSGYLNFTDAISFLQSDGSVLDSGSEFNIAIYLDYYPEGFDV